MTPEERKPEITEAVQRLIDMDTEMVYAKDIAPVVHMNPDVIVKYAKDGSWNICRFVRSGESVKFFRKDFLQKCGFITEDPPEKALLDHVIEELKQIRQLLAELAERGSGS